MSKYTEADVERDDAAVRNGMRTWGITANDKIDAACALGRMRAAALEGAKVPGLVADNAALLSALQDAHSVMEHMGDTLNAMDAVVEEDASAISAYERVNACVERPHPGAALLAEHEAKVSALQARVAELERERDAKAGQHERQMLGAKQAVDAVRELQDRAVSERDALQARVKELEAFKERGQEEFRRHVEANAERVRSLTSDRDALRAQVLQAQDAAYAQSFAIWGDAVRARQVAETVGVALSAPPAEAAPEKKRATAVHVNGCRASATLPVLTWECAPGCPAAETPPATERHALLGPATPVVCKGCGHPGVSSGRLDEVICYRCWDPPDRD